MDFAGLVTSPHRRQRRDRGGERGTSQGASEIATSRRRASCTPGFAYERSDGRVFTNLAGLVFEEAQVGFELVGFLERSGRQSGALAGDLLDAFGVCGSHAGSIAYRACAARRDPTSIM